MLVELCNSLVKELRAAVEITFGFLMCKLLFYILFIPQFTWIFYALAAGHLYLDILTNDTPVLYREDLCTLHQCCRGT